MAVHVGIQMQQKNLAKTFMMILILNWKKTFGLHGLYKKYFSDLRDKIHHKIE